MPIVVLALLVGLTILLTLLFRVNGGIVVLALCAGSILQQFVGTDTGTIIGSTSAHGSLASNDLAQLMLLFLPALLTIFFLRKSVSGSKLVINLLPAVAAGAMAAFLAVPLLPGGLRYDVMGSSIWSTVQQYQGAIVAGSMLIGFVTLWMLHPKHGKDKKHK